MSEENSLKQSIEGLGILVPVIRNKRTGHIIDGKHRTVLDPEAPVYLVDIPEELEFLARLAINNVRRNADADLDEWTEILSSVAGIQGRKIDEIVKLTGISRSTIYRHMPQELKDQEKSKAISEGRQEQVARATSPDKPENGDFVGFCEYHKISEPIHERIVNGEKHLLCDKYYLYTDPAAIQGHFRTLAKEQKGEVPKATSLMKAHDFDSWTHLEGTRKVQHSKMETLIVNKLRAKGYTVETDVPIVVIHVETIPDFNLALNDGRWIRGYIDNEKTHGPKQKDRDDELRALAHKKCPRDVFVPVQTVGDSDKEADEKVKEIEESMKWSA